jgi:undecaprenyl-diphosphatase
MNLIHILILAIVQGFAELLPVSSSAHVIAAEKLMGLDPTSPPMTLLLVMLHTGTMFAVIVYFWQAWRSTYFASWSGFREHAWRLVVATAATGIVGLVLLYFIKHVVVRSDDFEIEHLFGNAKLMAAALMATGMLIIVSSRLKGGGAADVSLRNAVWIGMMQGLCLPFRGFSRSGATISTGLALGVAHRRAEVFSFALAVMLTPVVIVKEAWRLYNAEAVASAPDAGALLHVFAPGLVGMVFSFITGLLALRWLTRWLEQGRWQLFGAYCLVASLVVLWIG